MEDISWLRQTSDKPLFPDLLWSRPETKRARGKLLIIGGNAHGFTGPAAAYAAALKAGSGTTRVILPDVLQKTLGNSLEEAQFASSTPSGSFARLALATWLEESTWAGGVLLAGDFGRNSETALTIESFLDKFQGLLIMTGDSLEPFIKSPAKLFKRPRSHLIMDLSGLQKLAQEYDPQMLVRHSMSLVGLVELLVVWTTKLPALIITHHQDHLIVVHKGRVSTTPAGDEALGPALSSFVGVWALQQPTKPFEAATTAIYSATNKNSTRAK